MSWKQTTSNDTNNNNNINNQQHQQYGSTTPAGLSSSTTSNANNNANNNKTLLEQQLHQNKQFITSSNRSINQNSTLSPTTNVVAQQFLSPSHQHHQKQQQSIINNNTSTQSSLNKTSSAMIGGSSITSTGQPQQQQPIMMMNNNTNNHPSQDMLINMLFSQQQQQQNGLLDNSNSIQSSSSSMDPNLLVQNLMMGLQTTTANNHNNNNQLTMSSSNNNLLNNNLDLNQLLQSTNQYFPNNNNNTTMNNNNSMDTMTQLLLSDVNNYMNNNSVASTAQNSQNDELLHQIINTLQSTRNQSSSNPQILPSSSNINYNNTTTNINNINNNSTQDGSSLTNNCTTTTTTATANTVNNNGNHIGAAVAVVDSSTDEHVPHLGSIELNQDPNKMYFPIACVNCRSRHKKCDKMHPSCSQCLKRGVDCLYRSPKKKGRHNTSQQQQQSTTNTTNPSTTTTSTTKGNKQSSNNNNTSSGSSSTVIATTSNKYQPYPSQQQQQQQPNNNNYNDHQIQFEFPNELKRLLSMNQGMHSNLLGGGSGDSQQQINEILSNISQLPYFQNQIAEKLNIAAYRKSTIELYEGVISLGYSLVDINLIEQALFESESIDNNLNYSPEILSLLYSIHAVTCQALGQDQQGFLSFQKSKNCLANFFDSWSNILVATTYCHLAIYCASKGDSDTAKFYLNFVDFYFGNRHKIDFDRLEEYVIDSNTTLDSNTNGSVGSATLRDLMSKHGDDPNIKNIMNNLGINSTEFLLRNSQTPPPPTRHIYERLPKEADFKLLKFRILCGITLDACGKEQYPVMLRIDPPPPAAYNTRSSPPPSLLVETSNDLSMLGKISPEGTFHLLSSSDGLVKMDSSNFKRYSFSSYFCKILADMHLYITGRIPKHVLHMLTEIQPTLENLSSYMEIIDNLSKIYREHEKRRKFNDLQLPLALCIFNLFVFGTKLFLVKEVYRKTKSTQKNTSPNTIQNNKGVLHFLNSEILKLSNVVTKCTTIENFELLKPNLMNSVASAAEVHLELLEALSEMISQHLSFPSIVETLELSNYFSSTFSAQDIQNPLVHKQILSQFEQQLLDMIDLDINALTTWKDRYGNDKYGYLIERMEMFKQRRSNQLFESIQLQQPFSNYNLNTTTGNYYNHEDNYSLSIPYEIQQNLQGSEIYKLASYLMSEIDKNKLN